MSKPSLPDRLGHLVKVMHGNTNAAARALGLRQSTLRAVLTGDIKRPRADLVHKLARHFGTTNEWLLTGEGAMPSMLDPTRSGLPWAALRRWGELVDKLNWPDTTEGRRARWFTEHEARRMWGRILGVLPDGGPVTGHATPEARMDPSAGKALGHVLDGLSDALELAIERAGTDAVREHLTTSLMQDYPPEDVDAAIAQRNAENAQRVSPLHAPLTPVKSDPESQRRALAQRAAVREGQARVRDAEPEAAEPAPVEPTRASRRPAAKSKRRA